VDAVRLMEKAVTHAPGMAAHVERLEAYRALVAHRTEPTAEQTPEPVAAKVAPPTISLGDCGLAQKLAALAWQDLGQPLTRDGCVLIPALLDPATCAELRNDFDADSLFAKTVVMDRPDFGQGAYRYFRAPIPTIVDQLRREVYPHVARIANEWQRLLS